MTRIVAWNILAGGGRRAAALGEQLARWQPEVVALCEFRGTSPSRALATRLAESGLVYQRRSVAPDHLARNAILVASCWPLRQLAREGVPQERERWLAVSVAAPEPFALGALHIPNRDSGRKYPFYRALLAQMPRWRRRAAILVGNTNSGWPGLDEEVPCFNPREGAFMDAISALGWADAFRHLHGQDRAYTWYSPNGRNGFRLDQAFVNPKLLPRLHRTRYVWGDDPNTKLSDHAAVIIDLSDRAEPVNHRNLRGQEGP